MKLLILAFFAALAANATVVTVPGKVSPSGGDQSFNTVASDSVTANHFIGGTFTGDGSGLTGIATSSGGITQLTGDVTAGPGSGSQVATIAAGVVDTGKLSSAAVTTVKIANSAVDTSKLAADSVTTAKLLDLNVTTLKIAALAVDTSKIAADAVTTAKILDANVTNGKLANGAVDTNKLATDSVSNAKILNGAVDTGKLATDAVTNTKLLSDSASLNKVSGGKASVSGNNIALTAGLSASTGVFNGGVVGSGLNPSLRGADTDSGIQLGGSGFNTNEIGIVSDGTGWWSFQTGTLTNFGSAIFRSAVNTRIQAEGGFIKLSTSTNADTSNINVATSGFVGIGNESPLTLLHVGPGATAPNDGAETALKLQMPVNTSLEVTAGGGGSNLHVYSAAAASIVGTTNLNPLHLATNNTNRVSISTGGHVSIEKSLSIGTTTANGSAEIVPATTMLRVATFTVAGANSYQNLMEYTPNASASSRLRMQSWGQTGLNNGQAILSLYGFSGTKESPAAITTLGNTFAQIDVRTADTLGATNPSAAINFQTDGTFGATTTPTKMSVRLAPATGGAAVEKMLLNSSGTLTLVGNPIARLVLNASQVIPAGANTKILWGSQREVTQGMHSTSVSSGNVTIPAGGTGTYYVNCGIFVAGNAVQSYIQVYPSKNGGTFDTCYSYQNVAANNDTVSCPTAMDLVPGDFVSCHVQMGTSNDIHGSATATSHMEVYKIK